MRLMRSKLFWFAAVLVVVSLLLTLSSAVTEKPTFVRNITGAIVTPLQNGVAAATDWFTDLFGYFYRYDALERENEELKQRIQEYEKLEIEYHAAVNQNAALREAAGIKAKRAEFELELCSVVSVSGNGFQSSLTLSRGSVSGIEVGDCVITGDGMVGYVDQVALNHCVVKTVIHVDFNASAAVSRTRDVVVASGDFELAADGLLKVPYLENDANIRVGDVILTNGGAYPPDLIVGRVAEVKQEKHGISSYAAIQPSVDLDSLSTVFVVKNFSVEE
ncbi:MAG: rod shape-determining protein MreC [Clostridia bacterium]|nr:rod shape-determining protein MreC [Clostridia bacterium]